MNWLRSGFLLATCAMTSCSLAPAYRPPHFILPASYHGAGGFSVATPSDTIDKGSWWSAFRDPTLDSLETEAGQRNPDLEIEAKQYLRARDLAAEAASGLYPHLGTGAGISENKQSFHRLFRGNSYTADIESSNEIEAAASWELDFWDKIRNRTRAQKNLAQGTAAELAAAQLSLQAQVADDYFALRGMDKEEAVYQQAIAYYQRAVTITHMRLADSLSSGLDVARAESQLASAQAQETQNQADRAVLLHAIADLVGVSASSFSLPTQSDVPVRLPAIPVSVPDALLQRRPDIAQAERAMAAANRTIGVARAAFYPNGVISADSGFQDNGFNLLSLPNSLWSIGATVALPIFEGGLRKASLEDAWAAYAQTRANYRATVLAAFQEVEDGLTLTQRLAMEADERNQALAAAETAQKLSLSLYTGGLTDYLDVVVAQETALSADVATVEVRTAQLQASVNLIRSLGGGWSRQDMPSLQTVMPFSPLGGGIDKSHETPEQDNLTGDGKGA